MTSQTDNAGKLMPPGALRFRADPADLCESGQRTKWTPRSWSDCDDVDGDIQCIGANSSQLNEHSLRTSSTWMWSTITLVFQTVRSTWRELGGTTVHQHSRDFPVPKCCLESFQRAQEQHDPSSSNDFAAEVVDHLENGKLVIIDQSTGDPDVRIEGQPRESMWRVFNTQP